MIRFSPEDIRAPARRGSLFLPAGYGTPFSFLSASTAPLFDPFSSSDLSQLAIARPFPPSLAYASAGLGVEFSSENDERR